MKISNNKLEAALQYASQGIPVFPIDANSKRPFSNAQLGRIAPLPHPERKNANGAISGGFHQATTDSETINAWWQQYPNANIGVPTGPESSIWALDIDHDPDNSKDGFASLTNLESKLGSLPHSIRTNTPRGGLHILFKHDGEPVRSRAGDIASAIDTKGVKADGTASGYILLPPSTRESGSCYAFENGEFNRKLLEPAPRWLTFLASYNANQRDTISLDDLQGFEPQFWPEYNDFKADLDKRSLGTDTGDRSIIQQDGDQKAPNPINFSSSSEFGAYLEAALSRELEKLTTATPGRRQEALFKATSSIASLAKAQTLYRWRNDAELQQMLFDASTQSGAQDSESERWKTIRYHWDRAAPRQLEFIPAPVSVNTVIGEAAVRISLEDVENAIGNAADEFMNGPVIEAFDRATAIELNEMSGMDEPVPPPPNATGWKIETGAGKTRAALRKIIGGDLNVVLAQPHHKLTRQSADDLGSDVEVWLGYDQPDIRDPDGQDKMCPKEAIRNALSSAGLGIKNTACHRKIWKRNEAGGWFVSSEIRCDLNPAPTKSSNSKVQYASPRCGMAVQREKTSSTWIVSHASLFFPRPDNIKAPTILCIDEDIVLTAASDKGQSLSLDLLTSPPPPVFAYPTKGRLDDFGSPPDCVTRVFSIMGEAAQSSFEGDIRKDESFGLKIAHLNSLKAESVEEAIEYYKQQTRQVTQLFATELGAGEFERRAKRAKINLELSLRIIMLRELLWLLTQASDARSGRLLVNSKDDSLHLTIHPLKTIHPSWTENAAILVMDAILANSILLEPILGRPIDVELNLPVQWAEEVSTRQIISAPVSANKLGFRAGEAQSNGDRNRQSIRRLVSKIALGRGWVLVIARNDLGKWLGEESLPDNVIVIGFGKVTGLNEFEDCNGNQVAWAEIDEIVCLGALDPGLQAIEGKANVITGIELENQPADDHGRRMWSYGDSPVTTLGGETANLQEICHPSSTVSHLAHLQIVGGLIQAIGRGRPIRRQDNPLQITLLTNLQLSIPLNDVVQFSDVETGRIIDVMLDAGLSTNPEDLQKLYPQLFETASSADALIREWRSNTVSENSQNSNIYIYIGL